MMMIFADKIYLAGLLTLPLLLAVYLIFRRRRPVIVSSLMLWDAQNSPDSRGLTFKKRPLPLSFWLEALILTLLALAAAGPLLPRKSGAPPLTVILDNSFSMLASPGDEKLSPRGKASAELRSITRSFPNRTLRIIKAGTAASSAGEIHSAAELETALKGWTCRETGADLSGALSLAKKLSGGQQPEILVLTDTPPAEKSQAPGVTWRALGAPLPNFAIIGASRSADGPDRCAVVIASFCQTEQELTVSAKTLDGAPFSDSKKIKAPPETETKLQFKVPPGAGSVKIEIADKILAFDNSAVLPAERRPKVRTALRLTDKKVLADAKRAVESSGNMEISEDNPELVISGESQKGVSSGWELVLRGGEKGRQIKSPLTVRGDHPLLSGIDFGGVIWGAPDLPPLTGRPLISAGDRPLLSVSPRGPLAWSVIMDYFPNGSALSANPAWPSMFRNLGEWIIDSRPGLPRAAFRAGEKLAVNIPERARNIEIALPGAEKAQLAPGAGRRLTSAREPGEGRLRIDGQEQSFYVNSFSAAESDLGRCASGEFSGERLTAAESLIYLPLSFALILAALALLALHQYLFLRRPA